MSQISACTLDCPDGCSLLVETAPDGSIKIRGNPDHPFTQGFCCAKVADFGRRLKHPDRIVSPLLKQDGRFVPVSWDQALDLCAQKIGELRAEPRSMVHMYSYGYRGVMAQASTVFFRRLGATGLRGSLCDEAGIQASIADFGSLQHNDPLDLVNAARIVNWGKDLSRTSVHTAALVKKAQKQGAQVITISPGGDGNQSFSDDFIRVRPGTDRFLAAAVIQTLWAGGQIDQEILERTANWDEFEKLLQIWSASDLAAAAGVSHADVQRLGNWYLTEDPTATVIGWGLQRYLCGGENVRFINALALLTGQVGLRGGGVYYNVSSTRNLASWDDSGAEYGRLLLRQDLARELTRADPPVTMAWIDGFNAVNQVPDSRAAARALENLDFVVVVDAFMTDTAARADLVLPPALMTESEDIVGACFHHLVNHSGAAVRPPELARRNFDILSDLGRRLDPPIAFPTDEECLARSLASPYLDVTLEELRQAGFARADHPDVAFPRLAFDHPDGLYRFPENITADPEPDRDNPLFLLSLVDRDHMQSQIFEEEQQGPPPARIAPDSPALAGLDRNRPVFLASPLGRLQVRLEDEPGLHPEAVIVRRGGWLKHGRNPNAIIRPGITDMGEGTAQYSQRVRLEN